MLSSTTNIGSMRALCWGAAWDMVRDAELPARDYVALVCNGLPAEHDISLVTASLAQAQGALTYYADAGWAPHFAYRDAQEYYEAAGAKRVIDKIRVPILLITAQDDPFVPFEATRASGVEKNPAISFKAPEHGGHCGFISEQSGKERFWAEQRVVEFCSLIMAGSK